MGTNPGKNEDIDGVVVGVGGGAAGDAVGAAFRDVGEIALVVRGMCMLVIELLDILARG